MNFIKRLLRCFSSVNEELKHRLPVSEINPEYVYGSNFFHMVEYHEGQEIRDHVEEYSDGSWKMMKVRISDLYSDQEVNDVSSILKLDAAFPSISDLLSLCERDPIQVVELDDNKIFLLDGNTRCILFSTHGIQSVEVKCLIVD